MSFLTQQSIKGMMEDCKHFCVEWYVGSHSLSGGKVLRMTMYYIANMNSKHLFCVNVITNEFSFAWLFCVTRYISNHIYCDSTECMMFGETDDGRLLCKTVCSYYISHCIINVFQCTMMYLYWDTTHPEAETSMGPCCGLSWRVMTILHNLCGRTRLVMFNRPTYKPGFVGHLSRWDESSRVSQRIYVVIHCTFLIKMALKYFYVEYLYHTYCIILYASYRAPFVRWMHVNLISENFYANLKYNYDQVCLSKMLNIHQQSLYFMYYVSFVSQVQVYSTNLLYRLYHIEHVDIRTIVVLAHTISWDTNFRAVLSLSRPINTNDISMMFVIYRGQLKEKLCVIDVNKLSIYFSRLFIVMEPEVLRSRPVRTPSTYTGTTGSCTHVEWNGSGGLVCRMTINNTSLCYPMYSSYRVKMFLYYFWCFSQIEGLYTCDAPVLETSGVECLWFAAQCILTSTYEKRLYIPTFTVMTRMRRTVYYVYYMYCQVLIMKYMNSSVSIPTIN